MKTVKISFLIIALTQCLFAQQRNYDMEILPQTTHFSGGTEIVFKIEPASGKTSWCSSLGVWYIETNPSTSTQTITGNSWGSTDAYGFNVCHHNAGYHYFWLTKNKMTITHDQHEKSGGKTRTTSTYFYIDFRDCGYGVFQINDITIRYGYVRGTFADAGAWAGSVNDTDATSIARFGSLPKTIEERIFTHYDEASATSDRDATLTNYAYPLRFFNLVSGFPAIMEDLAREITVSDTQKVISNEAAFTEGMLYDLNTWEVKIKARWPW